MLLKHTLLMFIVYLAVYGISKLVFVMFAEDSSPQYECFICENFSAPMSYDSLRLDAL